MSINYNVAKVFIWYEWDLIYSLTFSPGGRKHVIIDISMQKKLLLGGFAGLMVIASLATFMSNKEAMATCDCLSSA